MVQYLDGYPCCPMKLEIMDQMLKAPFERTESNFVAAKPEVKLFAVVKKGRKIVEGEYPPRRKGDTIRKMKQKLYPMSISVLLTPFCLKAKMAIPATPNSEVSLRNTETNIRHQPIR